MAQRVAQLLGTLLHKRVWDECDGLLQLTAEAFGILIHPTFYYGKGQSTFLHILKIPFPSVGTLDSYTSGRKHIHAVISRLAPCPCHQLSFPIA